MQIPGSAAQRDPRACAACRALRAPETGLRRRDAGLGNDEADYSATTIFNNFQHVNMGRMLYEGQRADGSPTDRRAWSINRNYYLGGFRYGFAEWSGDIQTGYASMALQRKRMLATVNLGGPKWSMDTGGFSGHPSPENYARWMEFSAFVPVFRVHGGENEKRQPWVYGPVAEAAAKDAMELRYRLMPCLYSTTEEVHRTGIGLVRPMFWEFPDDAKTATMDTEWMFGDALLVSPVVAHGATSQSVYLPAGEWMDYSKRTRYAGGQTIAYREVCHARARSLVSGGWILIRRILFSAAAP